MVISLLLLSILCDFRNIIRNLKIPTHLALRKKQDIVKGRIERMQFRYSFKWFSLSAMKNDITTVRKLISSTWYYNSNFFCNSGQIVAALICSRIIAKGNPALMFRRHVSGQLQCRLSEGFSGISWAALWAAGPRQALRPPGLHLTSSSLGTADYNSGSAFWSPDGLCFNYKILSAFLQ